MAAVPRTLDSRWIRRYRLFFFIGSIILSIQVFLAYKFFSINASGDNSDQERFDPSGKGKVYFEFVGQNEDPNGAVSSRRVKDDDEDSPSNSNAVPSIDNKHKVPPDKTLNNVGAPGHEPNKSVSNRTGLRLEELDFVPVCDVYTKEAISAIHRAKTQRCKQHLVNITCLIQSGRLYPKQLKSFCPAPGFTAGKSLGCFKDEKTFRLLSGYYANLKTTNSPQQCINMCLQSGFPYAGVEYSSECFCGNDAPPSSARLPDSSCNMKCPVDVKQACGGYLALSAFHTGVAKWSPAVARDFTPASNVTETPVRIVYLLTLNGRAVRQVRRLFKMLFHSQHYFYIHVDTRQDYLFRELLALEQMFPNVRLTRQRSATIWGGASLLSVLLRSMKEILQLPWTWDFIINLSESDLPVKTNAQLVSFLSANRDRNFVKSHGREVQRFIAKQGLDKTFVECDAHMWRVGDRSLPWGLVVDGGSDWVALGRRLVALVTGAEPLVNSLLVVFRHTLLPAESFFHTVLRNSELCDSYVDNNLHVTNWKRKLGCKCQYKHVVDWCGCSPNDFRLEDWPRIQGTESRQLFFARKFEPIINQAVINRLDQWLYGPYPPSMASVDSYWQSSYHHADLSPAPDDALVTVATSVARRVARTVGLRSELGCVREVTAYFRDDQYQGSLVRFEALRADMVTKQVLETWTQYQSDSTHVDDPSSRIKFLAVSSDFDVKEQLSLNWLSVLGPLSEPVLMWGSRPIQSAPLNASALWVDPAGSLADVTAVHLDADPLVGHARPLLPEPLLPGIWEVKLVVGAQVIASTRFLVVPLSAMAGVPLSAKQAGVIHKSSASPYTGQVEWEAFLPGTSERNALQRRAALNARRYGEDLSEWIDTLTSRFYRVVSSCVVSLDSTLPELKPCDTTVWSSLVTDPKSHVGRVNETSGRLDRW